MKLGIFSTILNDLPLEQALDRIAALGCECVELGTGAYPKDAHCRPAELLADAGRLADFAAAIRSRGLEISSLSCHGNPLHPDRALAAEHHEVFQATIRLAAKLGVSVVTTFSGCPGDHTGAKFPNWVTCPWPRDFQEILAWQWNEVAIPYWREQVRFAADHGVQKVALEAHPGFLVYNPATLLRLREATESEVLGANFDPSHFFWQGIDPVKAVRKLAGAIHHVHAKDTALHPVNADYDGYLDTKPYTEEKDRAWIFRTVGYGHGPDFWCDFLSTLRMCGYDGALSIEHEDSLMTPAEGLEKATRFLGGLLLRESKGSASWI